MEPSAARVTLRRLDATDLPFVVEQHRHHFPHGFFARLGPRFLTRYYLTYCTSDGAVALAARVDGARAGYLVGTVSPGAHRSHVLQRHRTALAAEGALGLLRHPRLIPGFIRTRAVLYLRKLGATSTPRAQGAPAVGGEKVAVLHHVVVLPEHQGRGIGTRLIAEMETTARQSGCTSVRLVTETGGQGDAYYRATGWVSLGEHRTRDGLELTTYTRSLGEPGSSPSPAPVPPAPTPDAPN